MAKQVTAYQTTDGKIWSTLEEAKLNQDTLDKAGKNPEIKEAIEKAFKSLPEYGKLVGKSKAEFNREVGNLNAIAILKDLTVSYTSQFAKAMEKFQEVAK